MKGTRHEKEEEINKFLADMVCLFIVLVFAVMALKASECWPKILNFLDNLYKVFEESF